jgi:glycosyltransferase involved in cell wall biosynthesis
MKTELRKDLEEAKSVASYPVAGRICMHELRSVRRTPRTMLSVTALKEAGFVVSVVDIEDERSQTNENIDGVSFKHVKTSSKFLNTRFRRWALIKALLLFVRSTLLLLRTPADIYHVHDCTALPACYIAARLRRKPLIFHAHELPISELDVPKRRWLRLLLTPLLAHMLSRCTAGIAASPYYEQVLRERYGLSKVALLLNVSPYQHVEKSDRLRQCLGLDPSVRVALYQGNIQPDRRLDILIRSAAFLEENNVVVMMGSGIEPTISEIKALIASEGLADRVKILPPVPYEELLDWTASADIGLTLIPPDGTLNMRTCLPNKLFEYLMAGLPVLTSPMEAVAPLVTSYDVGQVAPSLEAEDLGAAINAILKDAASLSRMHRNALNATYSEFNWENESLKLIQLYQDILAKQSKMQYRHNALSKSAPAISIEGEPNELSLRS